MNEQQRRQLRQVERNATLARTRRQLFADAGLSLGSIALASLLARDGRAAPAAAVNPLAAKPPHFAPKAKRVIFLFMAGGPSQLELFDPKPKLQELDGQVVPPEFTKGKRFAFIKGVPKLLGSFQKFRQHGRGGAWVSDLLPHIASVSDELCFIKSMKTDQFNHAPAQLLLLTGNQNFGGASFGAWATYGLGTLNQNLPGFVVLASGGNQPDGGKNLWGSSFLPSVYQGVLCRGEGDPILATSNPAGMDRDTRRKSLDALAALNQREHARDGDPETLARMEQYELAFRMQMSVPGVMDISKEAPATLEAYGAQPGKASFANNCLLARRLVESGVRFVQVFDWGWDIHGTGSGDDLQTQLPKKCREMDRPVAALIKDLKQRGLLDDTLVVWGGEFGRTPMNEARNGSKMFGRDHHPDCFTMFLAGGGTKPGISHGVTDDLGYSVVQDPVTVRDLQATMLHQLGIDPHRFSYPSQGLNVRFIGPENKPRVVTEILT